MKNWLKKQATEFTAIIGFVLIVLAFLPISNWVFFTIGVLLVAIDDDKAKAWAAKISPAFGKFIDEVGQ